MNSLPLLFLCAIRSFCFFFYDALLCLFYLHLDIFSLFYLSFSFAFLSFFFIVLFLVSFFCQTVSVISVSLFPVLRGIVNADRIAVTDDGFDALHALVSSESAVRAVNPKEMELSLCQHGNVCMSDELTFRSNIPVT